MTISANDRVHGEGPYSPLDGRILHPDELVPASKAAAILGLKAQTLANWRHTKLRKLRYCRIGRHIKYRAGDLYRFMAENGVIRRTTPPSPGPCSCQSGDVAPV